MPGHCRWPGSPQHVTQDKHGPLARGQQLERGHERREMASRDSYRASGPGAWSASPSSRASGNGSTRSFRPARSVPAAPPRAAATLPSGGGCPRAAPTQAAAGGDPVEAGTDRRRALPHAAPATRPAGFPAARPPRPASSRGCSNSPPSAPADQGPKVERLTVAGAGPGDRESSPLPRVASRCCPGRAGNWALASARFAALVPVPGPRARENPRRASARRPPICGCLVSTPSATKRHRARRARPSAWRRWRGPTQEELTMPKFLFSYRLRNYQPGRPDAITSTRSSPEWATMSWT